MPLLQPLTSLKHTQTVPAVSRQLETTTIINLLLISLCAAMVLCYILWANGLAAGNYRISMLHTELVALGQVNGTLQSQKTSMEDPTAVAAYAAGQNMIPATNISYVFENSNVALSTGIK